MFGEFFILFALERGRPRDVGAGVEKLGVDGVDVRLEDGERAFNLVYDLRRVGRLLLQRRLRLRASSSASLSVFSVAFGALGESSRVVVSSSSFVARSPTRTFPPTRASRRNDPFSTLATAVGRSAAAGSSRRVCIFVTGTRRPPIRASPRRRSSTVHVGD